VAPIPRLGAFLLELSDARDPARNSEVEVAMVGPAPCDECTNRARCAAGPLACPAFALFVAAGGVDRWREAPRQPSAEVFAEVFRVERSGYKPGPRRGMRRDQRRAEQLRDLVAL
jgi:hypothetical protein